MVKGFFRAITDVLRAHGCRFVKKGNGDHEIWWSPINNRTFPVDHGCMSRHTANAVMKQAGIDHKF